MTYAPFDYYMHVLSGRALVTADGARLSRAMKLFPVLGNIDSPANPDIVIAADMVEKARQASDTTGSADEAAMQTHRHHLRFLGALGI